MNLQAATAEQLWRRYAATWSASADVRAGALAGCVSVEVRYCDPNVSIEGSAALSDYMDAFHESVPGGRFDILTVLAHHDRTIARWALLSADGIVLQTGTSAARTDGASRFAAITGFFDPPLGDEEIPS
ncbi:nuclear transport factor 2 family protein [Streptomyces sp. ISL-44]|uniref:nuclear transport factor 2 family protein n=1 Tax=Streptomyces sp. ISL-44 TaxID=2819184 RepID=UPI001BEC2376|nr:nuclear transport factor 2 family protein [Streptomyces sp. ISL-44]MBT2542667.1 nuclear transport factor 2 family protein [Streptomyces sp. ISL-44]